MISYFANAFPAVTPSPSVTVTVCPAFTFTQFIHLTARPANLYRVRLVNCPRPNVSTNSFAAR